MWLCFLKVRLGSKYDFSQGFQAAWSSVLTAAALCCWVHHLGVSDHLVAGLQFRLPGKCSDAQSHLPLSSSPTVHPSSFSEPLCQTCTDSAALGLGGICMSLSQGPNSWVEQLPSQPRGSQSTEEAQALSYGAPWFKRRR